ncbi:MAG TPA: condensation domain-containing protein, partial [Mycobacteriales bacterium]|nr:condensation domain-containing protein [Mycobacteriales bacterium]
MTDSLTDLTPEQREAFLDAVQDRLTARAGADAIRPRDPAQPAPASYSQRRHWFLDRLQPGNVAYNVPLVARVRGPLDVAALEAALVAVIERHEVLRTTLHELDGEPVQRVGPPPATVLAVADPAEAADVAGWVRRVAFAPFDLSAGPLLRAALLAEAPDRHVLVLAAHHAVIDGWSLGLLLRELDAHYRAARSGRPADVPALEVQYADFAVWQRGRAAADVRSDLDYWLDRLAGAPATLDLPADGGGGGGSTDGGTVRLALDPAAGRRIRALCADTGTTPFMVLLAAAADVLGRWAGSDDVVLGAPVVGRPRPEVEPLVGDFLNTLALRVGLDGDGLDFATLLERVRRAGVDGYAHAALPFEQLVEAIQPERSTSVSPIFQVLVNSTSTVPLGDRLGEAELDLLDLADPPSKFPLTLYLREDEDSGAFVLDAVFQSARYSPARMLLLLRQVARLLDQVLADPQRPLAECSLVLPGDPV